MVIYGNIWWYMVIYGNKTWLLNMAPLVRWFTELKHGDFTVRYVGLPDGIQFHKPQTCGLGVRLLLGLPR
jgi:hypothetical protein